MKFNKKEQRELKSFWKVSIVAGLVILTGTVFYHFVEKIDWLDSFYFTVVTFTTLGYGDISPQTDIGKLFTVVLVLAGIAILVSLIDAFTGARKILRGRKKKKQKIGT